MAKEDSFKETFRRVRAESGLNILRILATALAAITMAVVSSRLTTVVNSLILTGMVSVGSALVNEFYRTVLTVGAERTKTVVAPIINVEERHHKDGSEDETQVLPAQTDGGEPATATVDGATATQVMEKTATAEAGASSAGPTEGAPPEDPAVGAEHPKRADVHGRSKWAIVWNKVRHNQVFQMSLVFAVVSLITLGISYSMSSGAGGTEIKVNRTEVSQSLSEEDKQKLVNQAVDAAKGTVDKSTKDSEHSTEKQTETGEVDLNDLNETERFLEGQINELRNENAGLQATVGQLQESLANESAKVNELLQRLEALEQNPPQTPEGFNAPVP